MVKFVFQLFFLAAECKIGWKEAGVDANQFKDYCYSSDDRCW